MKEGSLFANLSANLSADLYQHLAWNRGLTMDEFNLCSGSVV